MDRNNSRSETRTAMFLAMIIVLSVIAMSVSFAGTGGAVPATNQTAENLDGQAWWEGQKINVTHSR